MKPKKLTLPEMWDLYTLVGDGQGKQYLIDEMDVVLEKLSSFKLMRVVQILYGDVQERNPIKILLLMIKGLKKNNYFEFADFIKVLSNGRSSSG